MVKVMMYHCVSIFKDNKAYVGGTVENEWRIEPNYMTVPNLNGVV